MRKINQKMHCRNKLVVEVEDQSDANRSSFHLSGLNCQLFTSSLDHLHLNEIDEF